MPPKFPDVPPGTELFDVRPMLAEGLEPFDAIQGRWNALKPDGWLLLRAPFFPKPLIAHFSVLGVQTLPYDVGPGDVWLLLGPKP